MMISCRLGHAGRPKEFETNEPERTPQPESAAPQDQSDESVGSGEDEESEDDLLFHNTNRSGPAYESD